MLMRRRQMERPERTSEARPGAPLPGAGATTLLPCLSRRWYNFAIGVFTPRSQPSKSAVAPLFGASLRGIPTQEEGNDGTQMPAPRSDRNPPGPARFHPDRATRRDRDYRYSGGNPLPCFRSRPREGPADELPVQPPPARHGDD